MSWSLREKRAFFELFIFSTFAFYHLDYSVFNIGWGSTASRLWNHFEKAVYFLPLSSQKFLLLIWSNSNRWKVELILEPLSVFEHGTPGSEIQHLNHEAIAPCLTIARNIQVLFQDVSILGDPTCFCSY